MLKNLQFCDHSCIADVIISSKVDVIVHGECDRFIEPLKAPSKGRIEQKRDSSCADCVPIYHGMRDSFIEGRRHDSCVTVPIYHGMRDRFIEGRRHDSCVTVTIDHGVCDRFIEPLKAPSKGRIEHKRDSSCADWVTVYHGMRDRFIEGRRHDS